MTALTITEEQAHFFRLRRSGLLEPFATPEAAASSLVGIQAQILPAAGIALRLRTGPLTNTTFEQLLYEHRSLVKLWGQRGTLHLYPAEEWPLIHGALAGRATWWERQALRAGDLAGYHATVEQIAALLRERGTIGRAELRAAGLPLDTEMLSSWGGIFADLVRRGLACHAEPLGGEGRFAHREHWLPALAWAPPDAEAANVELARRYLRAYGPASVHDLAFWRGAPVPDARRWLAALGRELAELRVGEHALLALRDDLDALNVAPPPRERWPVRLLGRFDPLLLAHRDKRWLIDPRNYKRVWRVAGHIEGTVLDRGRIVATWRYERAPSGLRVGVAPFAPLPKRVREPVERQARLVAAFFGLPLGEVRFVDP
jgi:hypothetical protein